MYVQVGAGDQYEDLVARLRAKGFQALAIEVPGSRGIRRVLVGPVAADEEIPLRAALDRLGFQGTAGIRRIR